MKNYKKTSTTLFSIRMMHEMKKLRSELNEHRYYLERNVARETAQLIRRIDLLESCNATLCRKLALHKSVAVKEPADSPVKLYLLNTDMQRVA